MSRESLQTTRLLRVWLRRWRRAWRSFEYALARQFGLTRREDRLFLVLIVATGVGAGLLGHGVHFLVEALERLLWGPGESLIERARSAPWWAVVGAPTVGGLLVGAIVRWVKMERPAGGMAVLIEAVALSGGRVPPRPVMVDALNAFATVGTGGSLGREGPMIRLGAMISSWMATRWNLPAHRIKVLVGCGAAAGLAAVYNIPVGGALFAMEVILGNFALEIFGPIVASSVISTVISRSFEGDLPRYAASGLALERGWELLACAGLGVLGAGLAVLFTLGVRGSKLLAARLGFLPRGVLPVLGFALLGVLALWIPEILGGGAETISQVLSGGIPLPVLLALPLAKLLATALTRGSGGSGGLFTPSLCFGAAGGALFGIGLGATFPGSVAPPSAYAAVGMAAVLAGSSHAPISGILILFEFTGNYDLILPLMVAAITASLVARRLYPYSAYTEDLERRGVDLAWRMGEAALAGLKAQDLVRADGETLDPAAGYAEVVERFLAARRQRLFVVAPDGKLLGAVSLHDIKHALEEPESLVAVVAHDLMAPVGRVVHHDERLHRVAEAFSRSDFERLPVVDGAGRHLGVLAKRDLLAIYSQEVLGRPGMLATFISRQGGEAARDYVEIPPDFALRLVPVPAALVGSTLAQAKLPQTLGARVIEIKRRGPDDRSQRLIPLAETRFERGDELIVLGPLAGLEELEEGRLGDEP